MRLSGSGQRTCSSLGPSRLLHRVESDLAGSLTSYKAEQAIKEAGRMPLAGNQYVMRAPDLRRFLFDA